MSTVYTLEPPTKGKVVLRTTMGDIDIELWPKEAPRAVRNFAQLCLEGYYDNTPFHRIIKDFMVQGGDPTGTGEGGESIYGHPFKDEFHSRLKFNHRGLIACANKNKPDTNGSQFFITLDRTDHLDRKSTIFGKVTGDTVYNLLRFNELETDEDDRPAEPPRLIKAEVLDLPFDDIKPRVDRAMLEATAAAEKKRQEEEDKKNSKASRNFRLISFGDEAEEDEAEAEETAKELKIKSAHDMLEDDRLSKEAAVEIDLEKVRAAMREAKAAKTTDANNNQQQQGEEEMSFADKMRDKVLGKRKAFQGPSITTNTTTAAGDDGDNDNNQQTEEEEEEEAVVAAAKRTHKDHNNNNNSEEDNNDSDDDEDHEHERKRPLSARDTIAGMTRGTKGKSAAAVIAPSKQIHVQNSELLTNWERKREEYKEKKRLGGRRDKDTLAKLKEFQNKVKNPGLGNNSTKTTNTTTTDKTAAVAKNQHDNDTEAAGGYDGKLSKDIDHKLDLPAAWRIESYLDDKDSADEGIDTLLHHKLEFRKDIKGDGKNAPDGMDDYIVHDPLLEEGKKKWSKEEQKRKKRGAEWAGRSRD